MQKISIHAPRAGRDKRRRQSVNRPLQFQSTRPVRGATSFCVLLSRSVGVFQSTRPVRGATFPVHQDMTASNISIHAPRAGRDGTYQFNKDASEYISIHAPRAGRDHITFQDFARSDGISIHAPRAGRDLANISFARLTRLFQSTRPVRGATCISRSLVTALSHFNPRAPCGARP